MRSWPPSSTPGISSSSPGSGPTSSSSKGLASPWGPGQAASPPGRRGGIDGFTITGALKGGGIFVNAYAPFLTLSNNRLISNQGSFGGGIRVGTPSLVNTAGNGYLSSSNENLRIHHNHITQNGAIDGGGGVALFNGADGYQVTDNFVCGNFTLLYGGGIAHFGLSDEGLISRNRIVSNQSFDEGGGLIIAGELVPAGAPPGTLTPGAGSVRVVSNLIQGNQAGDDGGGVRTLMVNGQDVQRRPTSPSRWYQVALLNNLIVNNSSADVGGGISLDDTARAIDPQQHHRPQRQHRHRGGRLRRPVHPRCAVGPVLSRGGRHHGRHHHLGAAGSGPRRQGPQHGPPGRVRPGLRAGVTPTPLLHDNILWHNRAFYWDAAYRDGLGGLRPDLTAGEAPHYWDLAVYGTLTAQFLEPHFSILSEPTPGDPTNVAVDPRFVAGYFNQYQATSKGSAFGNFVTTTFLPTGRVGDYHLGPGSPANGVGAGLFRLLFPELLFDIDGEPRLGFTVDVGADESR